MKFINQEVGSSTCGQTTVAMLAGKTTGEICELMGKYGRTRTVDLIKVLDKLGIKVKNRKLKRVSKNNHLPSFAIISLRPIEKQKSYWGHWALLRDFVVYDPMPSYKKLRNLGDYLKIAKRKNMKITSFIEIEN